MTTQEIKVYVMRNPQVYEEDTSREIIESWYDDGADKYKKEIDLFKYRAGPPYSLSGFTYMFNKGKDFSNCLIYIG